TLGAMTAAVELGLLADGDAECLREAWEYASSVRSAMRLWSGRVSDTLPRDWRDLVGVAGVLGSSRDRTTEIVERWFGLSRRARAVFEREFFGYRDEDRFPEL